MTPTKSKTSTPRCQNIIALRIAGHFFIIITQFVQLWDVEPLLRCRSMRNARVLPDTSTLRLQHSNWSPWLVPMATLIIVTTSE
jgi:hypothetical protein